MILGGMTDGIENVLDEDILIDIDEWDDDSPTNPFMQMPDEITHPERPSLILHNIKGQ
jgi:hypothetical protein